MHPEGIVDANELEFLVFGFHYVILLEILHVSKKFTLMCVHARFFLPSLIALRFAVSGNTHLVTCQKGCGS
jgi:hypothetical protein